MAPPRAPSSPASARPRLRPRLPELVLVCCLAFTGAVTWGLEHSAVRADRARFNQSVAQAQQAIRERINTHVAVLHATAGLFDSQPVDEAAFLRFAARLRLAEDYPGIQGVGWSVRLSPGQSAAGPRPIWPTRKPEAHSIAYLHPLDRRNRAALGFNMFSEPTRRAAMAAARDSGRPAMTRPVQLVQEIDQQKQTGFLIYVPVYAGASPPQTPLERKARLKGFAYGAFRAGDLFRSIFGQEVESRHLRVAVYDGAPSPQTLIYSSGPEAPHPPQLRTVSDLQIAGRRWRILYAATPDFQAASQSWIAGVVLALGLFTSMLLYLATRELVRRRLAAEAAVARAEHEILVRRQAESHQQLLINELNHRVKNTLATVQSIGAQTLRTAPDMAQARDSYEARLIALSDAHNLLTARHWESADIKDVVRAAVAPFQTDVVERIRSAGPAAALSPAQALALAMALHELGTNAVKYGALSQTGGRVDIRWSRAADGLVELVWREAGGPPVPQRTRSGFGTRLIERSLARDLGGTVKLHFLRDGVVCEIAFRAAAESSAAAE